MVYSYQNEATSAKIFIILTTLVESRNWEEAAFEIQVFQLVP